MGGGGREYFLDRRGPAPFIFPPRSFPIWPAGGTRNDRRARSWIGARNLVVVPRRSAGRVRGGARTAGRFLSAIMRFASRPLASARRCSYTARPRGAVAQLGERRVRNAKVGSSILLRSTTNLKGPRKRPFFFSMPRGWPTCGRTPRPESFGLTKYETTLVFVDRHQKVVGRGVGDIEVAFT